MTRDTRTQFVDAWGAMGALWGINRSVARVHAFLMASEGPVSLDEIVEQLGISKGNASMSLKELRAYRVVKQVSRAGDRRDFYETEPDVWAMFFRILAERKRRELDPAAAAVREALETTAPSAAVRRRFEELDDLLRSLQTVADRLVRSPGASRAALAFLTGVSSLTGESKET